MKIEIERPVGTNSPRAIMAGGAPAITATSFGALNSSQSLGADWRSQVPTSQEMSDPAVEKAGGGGGPASTGAGLGAAACCPFYPPEHPSSRTRVTAVGVFQTGTGARGARASASSVDRRLH